MIGESQRVCYPFATGEQIVDPPRRVFIRSGQHVRIDPQGERGRAVTQPARDRLYRGATVEKQRSMSVPQSVVGELARHQADKDMGLIGEPSGRAHT